MAIRSIEGRPPPNNAPTAWRVEPASRDAFAKEEVDRRIEQPDLRQEPEGGSDDDEAAAVDEAGEQQVARAKRQQRAPLGLDLLGRVSWDNGSHGAPIGPAGRQAGLTGPTGKHVRPHLLERALGSTRILASGSSPPPVSTRTSTTRSSRCRTFSTASMF